LRKKASDIIIDWQGPKKMNVTCGTMTRMGTTDMGLAGLSSDGNNLEVFNIVCYD
jgi:hypothetical protein